MSNHIDLYRQSNTSNQKWVNLLRQSHLDIKGTNPNNEEDASKLISLEESLNNEKDLISVEEKSNEINEDIVDPESLFNLPKGK